jgi:hypothetical protein
MLDLLPSKAPLSERTMLPSWADRYVRVMDDGLRIPGTSFRIGLDGVIGFLLPEVGDALSLASGLSLLFLGWRRRAPNLVLWRMVFNMGVDALVGMVPVVGDAYDFVWKSNRKNLVLLERYAGEASHKPYFSDYLVLGLLAALALGLLLVPFVASVLLWRWIMR